MVELQGLLQRGLLVARLDQAGEPLVEDPGQDNPLFCWVEAPRVQGLKDHWDPRVAEVAQVLDQAQGRIPGLLEAEVHSCSHRPEGLGTGGDQLGARTEGGQGPGVRGNADHQGGLRRGRGQGGDHGGRQEEGARGQGQRADLNPHHSYPILFNLDKTLCVGLKKGHLRLEYVTSLKLLLELPKIT